jgi:hypothetical protein
MVVLFHRMAEPKRFRSPSGHLRFGRKSFPAPRNNEGGHSERGERRSFNLGLTPTLGQSQAYV